MDKPRGKLITFAIVLILSALACVLSSHPATEEASGEPSVENSPLAEENLENPAPESEENSELVYEIPIEACVALPDEYAWEFANVNNAGSNDTKTVCQGDFIVWNTSNRSLYFKWFEYWDNGAMQDIGWLDPYQRLAPGDEFSVYFGTQTLSSGNVAETVATFTKLVVFYALPDCHDFLSDEENEALWDEFAVPLFDPCR